jgi:hypothetical protein
MTLRESIRRGLRGNPFDRRESPDAWRRWDACASLCSGPFSTVHTAAHDCTVARQRHMVAEGFQ